MLHGMGGPNLEELARWEARLAMLVAEEQLACMHAAMLDAVEDARLHAEREAAEAQARHEVKMRHGLIDLPSDIDPP